MRWSLLEQRERSGGARNKLQVKTCNEGEFAGGLILVEKNMNSVLRYWETSQNSARERCESGHLFTTVGADVLL